MAAFGVRIWGWRALAAMLLALCMTMPALSAVLHRGNGAEPETLDPHKSTGEAESWIQYDLFEGLVTLDAAGHLVPGVARHWTLSADGRTYHFDLRPDAKWSDGTPVTADDFVFAWRRLVSPSTGSRYAFFIWPVRNGEKVSKGQAPAESLGVRALSPHRLEVELETPTGYFLASLQQPSTFPLSHANVKAHGDDFIRPGNLVSNGAFMLAAAVPQSHVKLVRNPHFHAADSVKLDGVYFHSTENRDTELKRFRAGELDVTYDIPDAQIPWLRENMPSELRLAPFLSSYYYVINLRREPWKSNPDLRAALSLAVDRAIIAEKITRGGEIPSYTVTPPGVSDYTPRQPEYAAWTQAQRDAKARELIAKAGYGPGGKPLEVEILFNTSDNHRKVAIALESMWRVKLGVRARLVNREWKVLLADRAAGKFDDIVRGGWIGDYDDAYSFLSLFRSDVSGQNHAGYANPDYDRLVRDAAGEPDAAKRRALMQQAESMLLADHPVIPIYTYVSSHMVADKVRGWQDNIRDIHLSRYLSIGP